MRGWLLHAPWALLDYGIRAIISTLPSEDEASASRFIFGLLIMGVLEYRPSLADGPFRAANILRDHADRRALERIASASTTRARFFSISAVNSASCATAMARRFSASA